MAEDKPKTYDDVHLDLIEQGYQLKEASPSGSRYYTRHDSPDVRVSDHMPNLATARWMARREVQDVRVVRSPKTVINDDCEFTTTYFDRDELSRSQIADFIKSRRLFEARYVTKTLAPIQETDAMRIGTLCHAHLLEPDLERRVAIIPTSVLGKNGTTNTNACREFRQNNADKLVMKQEDYETAMQAVVAVRNATGKMLSNPRAMREREIYWTHERTGLKLRAKLDLILEDGGIWYVPDIKTCVDLSRFQWVIRDGLWLQHAHYSAAVKAEFGVEPDFWFLAVEKCDTFRVRAIGLDDDTSATAMRRWEETLDDIASCKANGDWSESAEWVGVPDFSKSGEGEISRISIKL